MPTELRAPDGTRYEQSNADVLRWQTGYRVALALVALALVAATTIAGTPAPSAVAERLVGSGRITWALAIGAAAYAAMVIGFRRLVDVRRSASRTTATFMMLCDLCLVFGLVFALADPRDYDRALLLALFSLQLTHVYFGREPALLMLGATGAAFLWITDLAIRAGADASWGRALLTLALFAVGAALVTLVQNHLHERLARLLDLFARAEEGDFSRTYDVAADRRPDAVTHVGRAYNRMRSQLAEFVETDPLSGCLNRRGFEQQFRRELAQAVRAQTELAVVAIDLDHFKLVNDTHGHLIGDRVIAEMGELLRANARAGDVVARTGGEEFAILAPDTGLAGAQHLALRVLEACRRRTFADPKRIAMTVSIGLVADTPRDEAQAEELKARADEALYAAKRSGRNRLVCWSAGLGQLRVGSAAAVVGSERPRGLKASSRRDAPRRTPPPDDAAPPADEPITPPPESAASPR